MSSSREESPDWLRSFQAPTRSVLTLSSGSDSSQNDGSLSQDRIGEEKPSSEYKPKFTDKEQAEDMGLSDRDKEFSADKVSRKMKSSSKQTKAEGMVTKKKTKDQPSKSGTKNDLKAVKKEEEDEEKQIETHEPTQSIWTLSSDSESLDSSPVRKAGKGKLPKMELKAEETVSIEKKKTNNKVTMKGKDGDPDVAGDEMGEKHNEPHFSSARLPLVLPEKVNRSKALVECEGESIDLSGDAGSVGRVVISNNASRNCEMLLDLKGTIYKTTIVPSRTFCVVSFGQSEAKVEAIMNDFIQLKPQSNVYGAETMVEGTLEGFSFDSEDEADRVPKAVTLQADQNEGTGEQSNTKRKTKAEKTSALAGGPLVQARNFAVMTGVNAGISCVLKRIRGKEDVQSSMVAAFGSGAMFSLVSGMGGPNAAANVITSGLFFALVQGGLFKIGQKFSQPPAEDVFYDKTRSMLTNLGLQNYEKNFKKGLLTDTTLPLLTDSALRDVKIPPGPRLLILDHIHRDRELRGR